MAKSFEDKKQEIFNYLDYHSKNRHFQALSESSIHKKFDELFGKKIVEDILFKLGDVDSESLSYTIYYPKENKKFVSKFLNFHSNKILNRLYLITATFWLIIFYNSPWVQNYLFSQLSNLELKTVFIGGFMFSFFIVLLSSKIFYSLFIWMRDKKITLKNKKNLLFYLGSGIILISVIIFSQFYFPQYLTSIIGITGIIILILDRILLKFK
jgi:hypothetical protein